MYSEKGLSERGMKVPSFTARLYRGRRKNGRVHPNEKPVPLLRRLIKKCPEGTILDPFMGSGAIGEAALLEGRRFVGIEIEPAFLPLPI